MASMSPSSRPVGEFLASLPEPRRGESEVLIAMMSELTGADPVLWADKIIGFGEYRYRYDSGRTGTAPLAGFAPTVRHQTVYLASDFQERYPGLVADLPVDPAARRGAPRMSKACLYLPRLDAVRPDVLRALVERSVRVYRGVGAAAEAGADSGADAAAEAGADDDSTAGAPRHQPRSR